jgi:hypothetical protein
MVVIYAQYIYRSLRSDTTRQFKENNKLSNDTLHAAVLFPLTLSAMNAFVKLLLKP